MKADEAAHTTIIVNESGLGLGLDQNVTGPTESDVAQDIANRRSGRHTDFLGTDHDGRQAGTAAIDLPRDPKCRDQLFTDDLGCSINGRRAGRGVIGDGTVGGVAREDRYGSW